jgi:hypothetical protein
VEWDLLSDKVSAPPPMGSMRAQEIANGRTVVRHPHLCTSGNGRTCGRHPRSRSCGIGVACIWAHPRSGGGSASAAGEGKTHAREASEARTDSSRTGVHARVRRGLVRPARPRQGLDMEPNRCLRTQSHRQRHPREIISHPADGLDLAGGPLRLPVVPRPHAARSHASRAC